MEYDDYKLRFYYKRKGILTLLEGLKKNPTSPRLCDSLGFYLSSLGLTDEKKRFRELYAADKSFQNQLKKQLGDKLATPDSEWHDNFVIARLFYQKAIELIEEQQMWGELCHSPGHFVPKPKQRWKKEIHLTAPVRCRLSYASALQDEGKFDQSAKVWKLAGAELARFAMEFRESELEIINFECWLRRCEWEQDELTIVARKSLAQCNRLASVGLADFETTFRNWNSVFDKYPAALNEDELCSRLLSLIRLLPQYQATENLDELPSDFPLQSFIDRLGQSHR